MAIRDIITKGLFSPATYLVTKGFGANYTNIAADQAQQIVLANTRPRVVAATARPRIVRATKR